MNVELKGFQGAQFWGSRLRVGRNHGLNFHSILVSEIQGFKKCSVQKMTVCI